MIKSLPGINYKILPMNDDVKEQYIACKRLIMFGHTEETKDKRYLALFEDKDGKANPKKPE